MPSLIALKVPSAKRSGGCMGIQHTTFTGLNLVCCITIHLPERFLITIFLHIKSLFLERFFTQVANKYIRIIARKINLTTL